MVTCLYSFYILYTAELQNDSSRDHSLIEHHARSLTRDIRIAHKLAQLASLGVSLNHHNAVVILQSNSDAGARLVDRKLARQVASSSNLLDESKSTVSVDGIVDKRIRLDGSSARAEGRDVVVQVADSRCDEKFVIALKVEN